MATLTNYTGNAGLGLGSSPDISANSGNLNLVNQSLRDATLQDLSTNKQIWDQKIRDRDNLYDLLSKNQIQSGKILDKDRPLFDEAQRRQQKAWLNIKSQNDAKAIEEFQQATNDLSNLTTQAQARYLGLTQLQKEGASKQLPSEQEAYANHIAAQENKPFWDTIDPYQQMLTLNLPAMQAVISKGGLVGAGGDLAPQDRVTDRTTVTNRNGKITTTNSQTTTPVRSRSNVPRGTFSVSQDGMPLSPITTSTSFYDWDVFKRNADESSLSDETQRVYQDRWRSSVENQAPENFKQTVDNINQRLQEYNQQRGLQPNSKGYVPPVSYIQDQNGAYRIADRTTDFAAKTTLASVDGPYQSTTTGFDKDIANYLTDKDRSRQGWARIGLEERRLAKEDNNDLLGAGGVLTELTDIINSSDTPDNVVIEAQKGKPDREMLVLSDPTLLSQFKNISQGAKNQNVTPDQVRLDKGTGNLELVYFRKDKNGEPIRNRTGGFFVDKTHDLTARSWANAKAQNTFSGSQAGNINNILQDAITKNGGNLYNIAKRQRGEEVSPQQSNSGKQLKNSYKFNGKSISLSDLKAQGYSDDDIAEAVRLGNLK